MMLAYFGMPGAFELMILGVIALFVVGVPVVVIVAVLASAKGRGTHLHSMQSLVPCPDCGRALSPLAETCPNCGRPMKQPPPEAP